MLVKLWPGYREEKLGRINEKVDEDNGRGGTRDNGKFWKIQRFSRNGFWKIIGCLLSAPNFGLRGLRMWEKDPKISGNKRKRSSIQSKVDLYEVGAFLFQMIYYYLYTNTYFTSARFVASLTLGERGLGSIGQDDSSQRETRRKMSGAGQGC